MNRKKINDASRMSEAHKVEGVALLEKQGFYSGFTLFTVTHLFYCIGLRRSGAMGISWGANAEQVRQGMSQNGFSLHTEEKWGILTQQVFENGSYAGYLAYNSSVFLKYNIMYAGGVSIKGEEGGGIDAIYSHLKSMLQEKYGVPDDETQSWLNNMPSTGVKVTSTTWLIPNEGKLPHRVVLSKFPVWYLGKSRMDASVSVSYNNDALAAELNNREEHNI